MRFMLASTAAAAALLVLGSTAALADTPSAGLTVVASFLGAAPPSSTPALCGGTAQPPCPSSPPVQVRWGIPVPPSTQRSGLGFDSTATSANLDTNFVLGTLTHFNWPIAYPADTATLRVDVTAHTATDGDVPFHLTFPFGIDETPNVPPASQCVYQPATLPCPDAITLPGGSSNTAAATVGSHTYTLTIVGFAATPDASSPESLLVTQEQQDNQGYLIANLSRNNQAPVAVDDSATAHSGEAQSIDVLGNDSDPDGDPLSLGGVGTPGHGTAVGNADGTIIYTPDASFAGTDTFAYEASDGFTSTQATVTVTVTDTTPPALTAPADVTTYSTDGTGVAVSYPLPTATDAVDPSPTVTCAPPSGSTFPVGTTTVTCTATDASGNLATATFHVTVVDVLSLIDGLCRADVGPGNSLCAKASVIHASVAAHRTSAACSQLAAYAAEVRAQRGKRLSAADADDLLARVDEIDTALGC